jgi:hypothetical protein
LKQALYCWHYCLSIYSHGRRSIRINHGLLFSSSIVLYKDVNHPHPQDSLTFHHDIQRQIHLFFSYDPAFSRGNSLNVFRPSFSQIVDINFSRDRQETNINTRFLILWTYKVSFQESYNVSSLSFKDSPSSFFLFFISKFLLTGFFSHKIPRAQRHHHKPRIVSLNNC